MLPREKLLVSIGNNIVACNGARFAAYDVKGLQVATGNQTGCPWQQHMLNAKIWSRPYSTDNRSILSQNLSEWTAHVAINTFEITESNCDDNEEPIGKVEW